MTMTASEVALELTKLVVEKNIPLVSTRDGGTGRYISTVYDVAVIFESFVGLVNDQKLTDPVAKLPKK